MHLTKKISLFIALFYIASFAYPQPREALKSKLDRELVDYIDLGKGPGISAAVSINGSLVYSGQAGFSDLELGTRVSKDSVFRIGSITKQFTAAAILKLQELKRLNTNDSILDHLQEAPSSWRTVKISNLLNHTSGIENYSEIPDDIDSMDGSVSHKYIINRVRNKILLFNPGEKWSYSNTNFYLLGMIIERASGKSYDSFLMDELLGGLAPHNISYCYTDRLIANRVSGYAKAQGTNTNDLWINSAFINMLTPFSAGALCATAEDLVRWNLALSSGNIISPESYASMITNRKLNDGSPTNYGYGVGVLEGEDGVRIFHEGGIPGFRSSLVYYPEMKVCIAILINDESEEPFKVSKVLKTHIHIGQDL